MKTKTLVVLIAFMSGCVFADTARVSGTLNLQDFSLGSMQGMQISIELRGQATRSETATLDAAGSFAVDNVEYGKYNFWFKAPHWLSKNSSVLEVSGDTDLGVIELINGDANNDNSVGGADLFIIRQNWGKSPLVNPAADLNGDGSCGGVDLYIVRKNWGKSGEIPGVEMIYIPTGSFLMGNNGSEYSIDNEFPQHLVYLSGYCIGKYEVTRGEYRAFINAGGYSNSAYWSVAGWNWKVSVKRTLPDYWAATQNWGSGMFIQTDNHPVIGVSYYEAEAFCKWSGGHLPTEAQWEKAARWTDTYPYVWPWGNTGDAEKCNNWYDHNTAGGGYEKYQTAPVGSYPSDESPYGCMDMAGNVFEWCKDWYQGNYYSQTPLGGWVDPQGPAIGINRAQRGGGWAGSILNSRCSYRNGSSPNSLWVGLGFRLAR